MTRALKIHALDNVAVALCALPADEALDIGDNNITLAQDIPSGHKFALCAISAGENVMKYGMPIGHAIRDIAPGEWVHVHNLATNLSEDVALEFSDVEHVQQPLPTAEFSGYLRADGRAGIRNELWIIPTVGCVNDICRALERENADLAREFQLDGVFAFPHPFGCSQLGDDHENTRQLLAALCRHPNAGGVLVVGLGCENNTLDEFSSLFSKEYSDKLAFLHCQNSNDEMTEGAALLRTLAARAAQDKRRSLPVSKLVIGMKCGGSDGLSGITANPVVGALCDRLTAMGGSVILTEVPEMFGAESMLFGRCRDRAVFDKAVQMAEDFKRYFTSHGQTVYENPSPGNKDGGISTLEDKSLGCVQKGGLAPVVDVLGYGQAVATPGLNLLCGPGNDLVSATALTAAGAAMILFTTGRGTPFGAPAPTLKISTNSALFEHKSNWIDFNAGTVAEGYPIPDVAARLFDLVLNTANGQYHAQAERHGCRDIAIWKDGVTL